MKGGTAEEGPKTNIRCGSLTTDRYVPCLSKYKFVIKTETVLKLA